jgi:hypothetical protein
MRTVAVMRLGEKSSARANRLLPLTSVKRSKGAGAVTQVNWRAGLAFST